MTRIRLGPGGKVLLVLLGVGVILAGLEVYGLLDVVPGWGEGPRAPAGEAGPAGVRDEAPPEPPGSAGGGEAPGAAPGESPRRTVAARRVAPPPLMGEAPEPLALGSDTVWRTHLAAETAVRALEAGDLDLAPVDPAALAAAGPSARPLLVVGALPPLAPRWLCAREDPLRFLRAGMTVRAAGADRLLAAHVAEAKGIGAEALTFLDDGAADLTLRDRPEAGAACLNLAEVGAQTRRLVLARAEDARLYGRSYRRAADRLGALAPEAVAWLTAPGSDARGYAAHAAYLADLAARLDRAPPAAPPEVATWIVTGLRFGGSAPEASAQAPPAEASAPASPRPPVSPPPRPPAEGTP